MSHSEHDHSQDQLGHIYLILRHDSGLQGVKKGKKRSDDGVAAHTELVMSNSEPLIEKNEAFIWRGPPYLFPRMQDIQTCIQEEILVPLCLIPVTESQNTCGQLC